MDSRKKFKDFRAAHVVPTVLIPPTLSGDASSTVELVTDKGTRTSNPASNVRTHEVATVPDQEGLAGPSEIEK